MAEQKNIDNIRRCAIQDIKEKVKKEPRYLHPMNKERRNDEKRLEFKNGYEFTCWMQQNGIMKAPVAIDKKKADNTIKKAECKNWKEYRNKNAQKRGYKDYNERDREYSYNKGLSSPMLESTNWSKFFGEHIVENYIMKIFEDPIKMPQNNKGFDWLSKKGEKIQCKARYPERCGVNIRWNFAIRYNCTADWFILSGWDGIDSPKPLHVWIFHKKEMIRGRKFWRRESLSISPKTLEEFKKYEVTDRLEKLKEL